MGFSILIIVICLLFVDCYLIFLSVEIPRLQSYKYLIVRNDHCLLKDIPPW
ncbi:hypothetical protein D1AOALGA4SA_6258 [Olavius algarvensis Delta 1 endosymbiont]|nr:hypothetical protein D1AOALGA4SA_6258 [Olavius algarvensis Delta 1 endosymbiont]